MTTFNNPAPAIASDAAGDYVIVWQGYLAGGGGRYDIYAQRYNAAGVAQGGQIQVNAYTTNNQRFPSVAMDALGDFVITWESYTEDGENYGIYAQRYNAAGVTEGGEFLVNSSTHGVQISSSVGMDTSGNFVIAWQSGNPGANDYRIYAQRYDVAGNAEGGQFLVNPFPLIDQIAPSVAVDSVGDFVIAWQSDSQDGSLQGVYAQRFNAAGVAQGPEIQVNTYTTGSQGQPSVAIDASGNFVIAWESSNQDGSAYGVYAQRFNSAGIAQGGEFQVNGYTTGNQYSPAVSMDAHGDFVISWLSYGEDGSDYGVFAQLYNSSGAAQGGEFQVNTFTTSQQTNPVLSMDAAGDFVVSWVSLYQDGNDREVYSQRYQGNLTTTPIVILPTSANIAQTTATLGGDVTLADGASPITARGVLYSLKSVNSNPQLAGTGVVNVTASGTTGVFTTNISGLTPGATYSFVAYATNSAGTTYTAPVSTFNTIINHAPVGATTTVSVLEHSTYVLSVSDFGFTDPNDNPPNTLLAVKFTTLPTAGILTDNGTPLTAGQSVSFADIGGNKLIFTPNAHEIGLRFLCKFQVRDDGGTANGGADLDPNPKVLYIQIINVNDAPVGTSNTVTSFQAAPYVLKPADFGFTDLNDNPPNSLLAVKFPLLPGAGTLTDNGVALAANQFVSTSDIAAGKLVFTPNANVIGLLFLCKFQVQDNGGTANGGVNLDPVAKVMDIQIVHVNHPPVGMSGTVTGGQNVPYTFKTADFGFTDPNDNPSNALLAVKFTLLPGAGTLTDNGIALVANQFVSVSDIATGKLVFTPNNNEFGVLFLGKFQVQDNGGTVNGGVNIDPVAKVLDIKIVPVNHPPIGTSGAVATGKNVPYTFKSSDFGFSDPNDTPPNTLQAVKLTLLPGAGMLTDNGVALVANQFVSAADIAAGKLVFTPNNNLTGMLFLCKFQVQDNGGTANGGVNLDPMAKVLDINIVHV